MILSKSPCRLLGHDGMVAWWDGGMGILTPRHPVAWLEPKDRDEDDEPKAKKEGLSKLDGTGIIELNS